MFCWVASVNVHAHFLRPGASHLSCLQSLKHSYSSEVIKYVTLKNVCAWRRHFCPVHWRRQVPQIQSHLLRNHLLRGDCKHLYVNQLWLQEQQVPQGWDGDFLHRNILQKRMWGWLGKRKESREYKVCLRRVSSSRQEISYSFNQFRVPFFFFLNKCNSR